MIKIFKKHLILLFLAVLFFYSCGTGGKVVTVTPLDQQAAASLSKEERARLNELKKRESSGIDSEIQSLIEETSHFTVAEYLHLHPEVKDGYHSDYKVGGYDVLNITVYEEKDLSREAVRVSADGYISFPLIGRVHVDNLSTSEIETLISNRLAEEQYLLDAHVSVMVTEYNSKRFLVLGAVKTPGSYSLQARESVLDALSKAGGIDSGEAGKTGMIIRTRHAGTSQKRKIVIKIDLQRLLKGEDQLSNIFLADKDMVFVPTAEHFIILGEVEDPGSYAIPDRQISIVEAIGMAGGFTDIAARRKCRILRFEDGREQIIEVNVDAIIDSGKKMQNVIIQPNDVIKIPQSFF
jgi:polysaccharide export outer membrane protein